MKNKYIFLPIICNILIAQVSISDIKKLNNEELDRFREDLKGSLSQEVSTEQASTEQVSNATDFDAPTLVEIPSTNSSFEESEEYFGYNYFKKEISFFDNIPTPLDYKLGPGDEIIVSLWGETNSRQSYIINKDGMIFYENIGFINLSSYTLKSAEIVLTEELSRIYSTLKDSDSPSKLMLSLGKLKSMNIYFSGQIESPGINLVHPFSDIFSAIVQAGGISRNGSLREVQLIRNGIVLARVDFYSFFMNGKNNFSSIKLVDGDVVHIPTVVKRVSILGEVNRPAFFELLPRETLTDLIKYASGFSSTASQSIILTQIVPAEKRISDDNARTSITLNIEDQDSIILNNGDTVNIPSISPVDLSVSIFGRVKSPGQYPGNNTSLKSILTLAGGFDDPTYRKTIIDDIVVIRKNKDQFYSTEFTVPYDDADKFILEVNDKILVYENINYKNSYTYRIEGEVLKPGIYPMGKEVITVGEALAKAGGLTSMSSTRNIIVKQETSTVDRNGNIEIKQESVNNVNLSFEIGVNSVIIAAPLENVVRVVGNVYNPGLITYQEGLRYPRYIELAGGFKPDTLKNRTYIKRANGNIEKVNGFFISRGKRVYAGDTIFVPENLNPSDFDITSFVADLSSTLANVAAIFLIVDNQTN